MLTPESDAMMAEVVSITYWPKTRTAHVELEDGCCVDMRGCIDRLVKAFPEVRHIKTFSGSTPDTWFVFGHDGWDGWQSYRRID